jgi:predicted RecB family nuclease
MKITNRIVAAYLYCKLKAYRLLRGETGTPHDYEVLMNELADEYRPKATEALLDRCKLEAAPRISRLTLNDLKQGHPVILNCTAEIDQFEFHFDALSKVDRDSWLGSFHYRPVLFRQEETACKSSKVLLGLGAIILGKMQGCNPEVGILVAGLKTRISTLRLAKAATDLPRLLDDLDGIRRTTTEAKPRLTKQCDACEFRDRCRAEAVESDDLTLLRGMSDTELRRHNNNGIFTVNQLSYTFRPRRRVFTSDALGLPHYHALKALALRTKTTYVIGAYQLPTSSLQIYFDLEGRDRGRFVYLIGARICDSNRTESHYFWADGASDEQTVFDKFVNALVPYLNTDFTLFHYGQYEMRFLTRMRRSARRKRLVDKLIENSCDLLPILISHVYLPTYSNRLKDILQYLGFEWDHRGADGLLSIVWRRRWELSKDDDLKTRLITYNRDDCVALECLLEFLQRMHTSGDVSDGESQFGGRAPVIDVRSLDSYGERHSWRTSKLTLSDFISVNKCAYFDYQRAKVFARTNKTIRRAVTATKKVSCKRFRINRRIDITARCCPSCKSRDIEATQRKPNTKLAFDLKITTGKLQRQVIECRAVRYRCRVCQRTFLPERFKHRDRHCHALRSWSIQQHIEYRASYDQIVSMFDSYFDLPLDSAYPFRFKEQMAFYYRTTYQQIRNALIGGSVLHADETEVRLKTHRAYVWVFTNLEYVYYVYRPTREGEFLDQLLRGFGGVLVSDFYGAYDSLPCLQQKCLVHLMRDINNQLLRHPYDEDLQWFAREFGVVLREIVDTVDRFGLRRTKLRRHKRAVKEWLQQVVARTQASSVADQLVQRVVKYRDRLFTFLEHDGVSWNNNNAENAIKQFALHRPRFVAQGTERSLEDYLLLLSICQTCKYKGISFLDFMLSRCRNFSQYTSNWRRSARTNPVEIYPKALRRRYQRRSQVATRVDY